jgi:serine/threonine-protein kinase
MTTSEDARVGTDVGAFRILGLLGRGGMGIVYRALDTRLEREVALKLVREEGAADPDRHRRILREARVAASISHPNIAMIFEVGETDARGVYIAMELVHGKSLRELIDEGPMPIDRAVDTAAQIGKALGAAHAQGVVHRDVKPDNVIVTPAGDVKVLDFGIAKALSGRFAPSDKAKALRATPGNVPGTPEYMSPEHASGGAVDPRSDVFALGVLMYEMLAGRRPFRGETPVAVLLDLMLEDPTPLRALRSEVPPEIARVVERCLEKAPSKRFESGAEVAAALLAKRPREGPDQK